MPVIELSCPVSRSALRESNERTHFLFDLLHCSRSLSARHSAETKGTSVVLPRSGMADISRRLDSGDDEIPDVELRNRDESSSDWHRPSSSGSDCSRQNHKGLASPEGWSSVSETARVLR